MSHVALQPHEHEGHLVFTEHGLVYRATGTSFIVEFAEIQVVRQVIADGGEE